MNPPWTFAKIAEAIPADWIDAEVVVGTSVSKALTVKRVVLSTSRSGKRVVVIHAEELKIKDEES